MTWQTCLDNVDVSLLGEEEVPGTPNSWNGCTWCFGLNHCRMCKAIEHYHMEQYTTLNNAVYKFLQHNEKYKFLQPSYTNLVGQIYDPMINYNKIDLQSLLTKIFENLFSELSSKE